MSDYERIAGIIEYLDEKHIQQPDLAQLAQRLKLSPSHFHRLFTRWAGVTPKDFLQFLTFSHAKKLLRNGASALHAALDSGLSGPSRLHDLCIQLEAASPGELKSGGAGLQIRYGFAPTPFGQCLVAETKRGLCRLAFVDPDHSSVIISELRRDWPSATLHRDDTAAAQLSALIFKIPAKAGPPITLNAFVRGTPFQLRVWRALLQVPPGSLVSYGQLATACGHPKAARAVGTAVARNPIAILIPCHRVIRETGLFGQYRWGTARKRSIVAWESLNH